jgi:hypothetical protein
VIVYIETTIKKTFGKIPDDPDWFACKHSDAIKIGSFTETTKTYEKITCMYPCDAERAVLLRRQKLIDLYCDKTVWFDVKIASFEDYDFEMTKLAAFERKYAI